MYPLSDSGEMVSATVSGSGRAFLWGCGTNAQLGNAGKRAGLRNAGLEDGENGDAGDDDLDEIIPLRLESQHLAGHRVLQVEFGGQHTLVLARSNTS